MKYLFNPVNILILVISIIYMLAYISPGYWSWGIFSNSGYDALFVIFVGLCCFLTLAPKASKLLEEIYFDCNNVIAQISFIEKLKKFKWVFWASFFGSILCLLQAKCHILGDGDTIISNVIDHILISPTAFGYSYLIRGIVDGLGVTSPMVIIIFLKSISIVSGLVVMYYVYQILALLIQDISARIFAFTVIITSGLFVLFMGHVETYPMLQAVLALYLYYLLLAYRGRKNIKTLLLIFTIGVFFHLLFIVFLPALLFVINKRLNLVSNKTLIEWTGLCLVFGYICGLEIIRKGIPLFIPPLPIPGDTYHLLAPVHFIDFFNAFLILGPVIPLLSILMFFVCRNQYPEEYRIFTFAAFPVMFFLFMLSPMIGAYRDWDLFSIFCLPLVIFGTIVFINVYYKKVQYLLVLIILLNTIHLAGFITNNKNITKSVDRTIAICMEDPHYQSTFYNGVRCFPFFAILYNIYQDEESAMIFYRRIGW